jgi:hypothetical protein
MSKIRIVRNSVEFKFKNFATLLSLRFCNMSTPESQYLRDFASYVDDITRDVYIDSAHAQSMLDYLIDILPACQGMISASEFQRFCSTGKFMDTTQRALKRSLPEAPNATAPHSSDIPLISPTFAPPKKFFARAVQQSAPKPLSVAVPPARLAVLETPLPKPSEHFDVIQDSQSISQSVCTPQPHQQLSFSQFEPPSPTESQLNLMGSLQRLSLHSEHDFHQFDQPVNMSHDQSDSMPSFGVDVHHSQTSATTSLSFHAPLRNVTPTNRLAIAHRFYQPTTPSQDPIEFTPFYHRAQHARNTIVRFDVY